MRGRAPTPGYLKLLRGTPGKRPVWPEPEPRCEDQCPPPPSFVQGYAAQEWARIAPELYRLGLLTAVDVSVLASYCLGYSRWRQSEELIARMAENDAMAGLLVKGADGVHKNPLLRVSRIAVDQMMQAASQLGLTPIARTRLAAGIHGQPSLGKFSGLLGDG